MDFSLEEAKLWVTDSYFSWMQLFEVKNILMLELFLTNLKKDGKNVQLHFHYKTC